VQHAQQAAAVLGKARHLAAQHEAAELQHAVDEAAAQGLHQHAQRQVHQLCSVGELVGGVGQPVAHHSGKVVGVEPACHALEIAGFDLARRLGRIQEAGHGLAQGLSRRQGLGQQGQGGAPGQRADLGHELAVGQQTFEHSVRQALELLLQLVIGEAGRLQGVGQRLLDHRVKVAQHDAVLGGEILVDGGVANAGGARDVLHRRAVEALAGHQIHRAGHDLAARGVLLLAGGFHFAIL